MLVLPNHADSRMAQGSLRYANHFFTRPLSGSPSCTMFHSATPTLSRVLPLHPNSDLKLYLPYRFLLLQVHARCAMHAALHTPKWSEIAITGCVFNTGVHCTPRQSPTLRQSHLSFLPCHYRTKKPPEPRSLTQPTPPLSRIHHHTKHRARRPALSTAIVMRECNQAAPVCLTRAQIHAGALSKLISAPVPTAPANSSNK